MMGLGIVLLAVGVFAFCCVMTVLVDRVFGRRRREDFEARFPPITDDEFLARCRPGTTPEIALKVRRILADALGVEYERIFSCSRLIEDLDAR